MPAGAYSQDVLTRIYNVHWGGEFQVVVGMPADPTPSFGAIPETMSTKDGRGFDTSQFGAATFSGASGLGHTVIGKNYALVAFGKPKNGPPCFIVVDGNWFATGANSIRRGVLDMGGNLEWTVIGSFPSGSSERGAYSCSFAGDGFFIQYPIIGDTSDDADQVHMSVSFDGMTFQHGISPFEGVNAHDVCNPDDKDQVDDGLPVGGSVAFDKTRHLYVTTGSFDRTYSVDYTAGTPPFPFNTTSVDRNFMSSTSGDGINWAPKFDRSQGAGINNSTDPTTDIGHTSAGTSTVCFSDALRLFVASSTYKDQSLNLDNSDTNNTQTFPLFIEAAAVATSSDGVNWINRRLGPPSTLVYGEGATYAFSYCVAWSSGFFLLGASGGTNVHAGITQEGNQMWRSEDGNSWTQTRASDRGFPQAMTLIDKSATIDKVVYIGGGATLSHQSQRSNRRKRQALWLNARL